MSGLATFPHRLRRWASIIRLEASTLHRCKPLLRSNVAHDDFDDDGGDEVNVWYRLAFGRMDGGIRGFFEMMERVGIDLIFSILHGNFFQDIDL